MPRLRFALLLPLLCAVCATQAQVYTWVDADGQKHFGSMPPTPEQAVQPVEIRASSPGNTQPAPTPEAAPTSVADTTPSHSSQANQAESSPHVPTRKMCGEAVRWTGIDLPNLKEIALERRRQGRINQSQYQQAMKALDQVKAEVTVPNCLASKDKDQRRYECLAQGLGIAICSGALSEALNKL